MTQETSLERNRDLSRLELIHDVVDMKVRQNLTNAQIAKNLGISSHSVDQYLSAAKKHYIEKIDLDLGEQRAELIAQLDIVKREAWNAWSQSKEEADRIERITELGDWEDEERPVISAIVSKIRRNPGNPRYLQVIQDVIRQEAKLLGLEIKRAPTTDDKGQRLPSSERRERIIEIIANAKSRKEVVETDDIVDTG